MVDLQRLNLNSLRVVESAARNGSFIRAAEEQFISPSAVSQRVKRLEAQLQFKIFNRRNNSVVLTSEGDAFIAHVKDALDTIQAAGIEASAGNRENILKVSALPTFSIRWLLKRLPDFQTNHSKPELNISHSYHAVDFALEDVDVAIRYGSGKFSGLESRLLFSEGLTPVCSPKLLEEVCRKRSIDHLTVDDLRHFTLLHSATCALNWQSWLLFVSNDTVLNEAPRMNFDSCMMAIEAAHAGVGFTVGSLAYVASDIEKGKLIAPFGHNYTTGNGWYLVYPRNHGQKAKVQIFENWLVAQAQHSDARLAELFA